MRHSLLVSVSILAGCLLIGLLAGRSSTGQTAAPDAGKVGRYQVTAASSAAGFAGGVSQTSFFVLCDTVTGQCWMRTLEGQRWLDCGNPAVAREVGDKAASQLSPAAVLEEPDSLGFVKTHLYDVAAFLKDRHAIDFTVDPGVSIDTTISFEISNVKLKDGLRMMLEPHGLEYVILKDKVVFRVKTPRSPNDPFAAPPQR